MRSNFQEGFTPLVLEVERGGGPDPRAEDLPRFAAALADAAAPLAARYDAMVAKDTIE